MPKTQFPTSWLRQQSDQGVDDCCDNCQEEPEPEGLRGREEGHSSIQGSDGNSHALINDGYLKKWKLLFRNIWVGLCFQLLLFICFIKKQFSKYVEKIPLAPPRPEEGVFFKHFVDSVVSTNIGKQKYQQFSRKPFQFVQITIIYKGTQVTKAAKAIMA